METEFSSEFLGYQQGRYVFRFTCPTCKTHGELGVSDTHNRNAVIPCPARCGSYFIVRYPRALASKPSLEYAFGPRKPARSETQATKKGRKTR